MRHQVRGRKLNRSTSHRKAMFRNMVTDLLRHERIQTTTAKAKECRSLADRMITYAKAGDLNSRRMAAKVLRDPKVLQKLFTELGPRYADRPGGYTRVLKMEGMRHGDNAEMSVLELVEGVVKTKTKKAKPVAAEPEVEEVVEETVEETAEAANEDEAPVEETTEDKKDD
jgi:large subunit ribosomal protein L17